MPRSTQLINSFNAGEWSPTLWGRSDLAKYPNACAALQNFIPLPEGTITRRPGTRFVAETKNSGKVRLLRFEFSVEQAYIIEAGDRYFRFYKDRGQIQVAGAAYEIATPYTVDELSKLKYTQSADILYLVHPTHPPMKLSRAGHTNWTLTTMTTRDGPYMDVNLGTTTITASGVTGTVTLTASAPLFDEGHVGAFWSLGEPSNTKPYTKWQAGEAVASEAIREWAGRVYQSTAAGTCSTQPPVHDEGAASDGVVQWTYLHNGWGYGKIITVTSPTQAQLEIIKRLPSTTATKNWREGAWSPYRGYPSCVTFYEERLFLAATKSQPQTFWASMAGEYENFAPLAPDGRVSDDTALSFTISDDRVNAIRWMSAGRVLFVGTVGGETTVKASNLNEALTPSNITVKRESTVGSADMMPERVNDTVLYVQRAGRRLMEMGYNYEADAFQSPEVTLLARHLTRSGIVEIAYQQEPWSILWCACGNGSLIGLTYLREQEVTAWHQHPLGAAGKVLSLSTIPGRNVSELWLVTERTINGQVRRYVEFMEEPFIAGAPASASIEPGDVPTDKRHAFFVDCGLSYRGTPVTTLTGLDHLEGQPVKILADGATHPDRKVKNGSITLDRQASMIHVGLYVYSRVQTLPVVGGAADGVGVGKQKRIVKATVQFHETLGAKISAGGGYDKLESLPFREGSAPMDDSPPLLTGVKTVLIERGWSDALPVILRQDDPLPCTILGIAYLIQVNDG